MTQEKPMKLTIEDLNKFRERSEQREASYKKMRDIMKFMHTGKVAANLDRKDYKDMTPDEVFDLAWKEATWMCAFCGHGDANHSVVLGEPEADGSGTMANICEVCHELGDEEIMWHDTFSLEGVQMFMVDAKRRMSQKTEADPTALEESGDDGR